MQIHKHLNIQIQFLEKKVIFETAEQFYSQGHNQDISGNALSGHNYPKECRKVIENTRGCYNNLKINLSKNPFARKKEQQCIENIVTNNKKCQNALSREVKKNYDFHNPPEPDINTFGVEDVIIGRPIQSAIKMIEGGKYLLQFGGKFITFTKEAYAKIFKTLKSGKTATVTDSAGNIIKLQDQKGKLVVYENFTNSAGRTAVLGTAGKGKYISEGGFGVVTDDVYTHNGKAISMVTKTIHPRIQKKIVLIRKTPFLNIHKSLKRAKIPTFKTLRVNEEGTKIISTPLNRDGIFAISANNKLPKGFSIKNHILSDKAIDNLVSEVSKTINKAINHNITLPTDSIFFLFGKQGRVSHMIGDFDLIQINKLSKITDSMGKHMKKLEMIESNIHLYDSILVLLNKVKSANSYNIKKIMKAKDQHYNSLLDAINR